MAENWALEGVSHQDLLASYSELLSIFISPGIFSRVFPPSQPIGELRMVAAPSGNQLDLRVCGTRPRLLGEVGPSATRASRTRRIEHGPWPHA